MVAVMIFRSMRLPGDAVAIPLGSATLLTGVSADSADMLARLLADGLVEIKPDGDGGDDRVVFAGDRTSPHPVLIDGAVLSAADGAIDRNDVADRLAASAEVEREARVEVDRIRRALKRAIVEQRGLLHRLDVLRRQLDPASAAARRRAREAIEGDHGIVDHVVAEGSLDAYGANGEPDFEEFERTTVTPIADALAALRAFDEGAEQARIPSPEANDLADELEEISRQIQARDAALVDEGVDVEAAEEVLTAARQRLEDLERAAAPEQLSAADIAQLEAAHEAVLQAEERVAGRFRAGKALKQLEAATKDEQAVLDRLGFATWSAYIMGTTVFGSDEASPEAIAEAKSEVEALTAAVEETRQRFMADSTRRELLEQLAEAERRAVALVGQSDDLCVSLRAMRVVAEGDDGTSDRSTKLRQRLAAAKVIEDDSDMDDSAMMAAADRWLTEIRSLRRARRRLNEADRSTVRKPPVTARGDDRGGDDDERLARELADAEMRVGRHRAVLHRIAEVVDDESDGRERVSEARRRLAEATAAAEEARRELWDLAVLATIEDGHDVARPAAVDALPPTAVVVVDPLGSEGTDGEVSASLLERLCRRHQVVLIGDGAESRYWAERVGAEIAEVGARV